MKYKDLPPDKNIGPYAWNHQAHLGSGAFGKVYLGKDTKANNQYVAVKVMENKQISDPYLQEALKNEIKILKTLKGDNVVGLYDYLATANRTYIIQMFCNQGDFRAYLTKKTKLPEPEAKKVLSDLLTGFKELVDHNLVHRDLKPENILIHDGVFKVADYGFGKHIDNANQMLKTCCGTPLYMSPQIHMNQPYTSKSDVFSMGLIYYEMLFGNTPWQCRSVPELLKNMKSQPIRFPYGCQLSKESQDFIMKSLAINEDQRLSWQEVFQHPVYIKKATELNYQKQAVLSKEIIQIIMSIQQSLQEKGFSIDTLFKQADKSKNNQLDANECKVFLKLLHPQITDQECLGIFQSFDTDKSGFVTYQEFCNFFCNTNYGQKQEDNAILDEYRAGKLVKRIVDLILDQNINIDRLFKQFDSTGDTNLDLKEFSKILKVIDETILDKECAYVFKRFDKVIQFFYLYYLKKDNSGTLTLKEFRQFVLQGVEELGGDPESKVNYGAPAQGIPQEVQQLIHDLRKIITVNNLDFTVIFQSFDKDYSGKLSQDEFSKLLMVVNARLTKPQQQIIFQAFDKNKDGEISLEEFKNILWVQK